MTNPDATPREHKAHAPRSVACWVLTVSDTKTPETDTSGALIRELLHGAGHRVIGATIVRDEPADVQRVVREACGDDRVQAVIVTGGTGITARDATFEAIEALLDKRLPGFGELFRMLSYAEIGAAAGGALASWDAGTRPELRRITPRLADRAARLRPGLGHVAVRRTAGGETRREEEDEPRRATGSGFVIDGSGLIVTNAHVVESAEKVQVRLSDGRRYTGTLVGRDNRVDLALIRIDGATNLTVLPLGDSNRLRVGEFVLALGHPFGLEQSASFGIVSRKGAPLTIAAPGFDFIQTDAAIKPGHSGGPLEAEA